MRKVRGWAFGAVLFGCGLADPTAGLAADPWPTKPIRAVIPFGAGSATDVVPRVIFEQLSAQLGQPIIVENRAGAGGTIGTASVAKAEPDGNTLLATSSSHTVAPSLYPNLPYDAARDFVGVGMLGNAPNVLIISPARGIKTVAELVAAAKAKPGSFSFATLGVGSGVHMSAERFRLAAGYEAVHVPFRGGAEALTEVIAGRVDYYFCPIATALPLIQEGRLVPLVVSSPDRASALPDVPTTLEAGFPDSDYTLWIGLFAPAKTPPEIVARLHGELQKAMDTSAVKDRLAKIGVDPLPRTPAELDAQVKREVAATAAFVRKAGMRVD